MWKCFNNAIDTFYMHHTTDRIAHTMTFVTPVVDHWLEREIAQWVHHEGLIRQPIALMSERCYHGATSRSSESAHFLHSGQTGIAEKFS